ncbi:MAG: beta-ketoacyl synthase N-terminal-like domain-containing protein [Limisphaerales bacterium]
MLFLPQKSLGAGSNRVVITGAGIITALGFGWKINAEGFRAGRTAFRPVTLFDVSRQRAKIAAEVNLPPELPLTKLSAKILPRLNRAARMLLHATHEAWAQAGLAGNIKLPKFAHCPRHDQW